MSAVRIVERFVRPAPLGVMFWDLATAGAVREDLRVTVYPVGRPEARRHLFANHSGVWVAARLPGLGIAEFDASASPPSQRAYTIEVEDNSKRFLPLAFDAMLPVDDLYGWPGWAALPAAPLAPLFDVLSPSDGVPARIPLFSAPARAAPGPAAAIHCQIMDLATERYSAWALLTASYAGRVCGIGMAVGEGRATLIFAYPDRPRPALATSPPAVTDFRWPIDIAVFSAPVAVSPSGFPIMASLFAQLHHPRPVLASTLSPPELLPSQLLGVGRPLTLRTSKTPDGPSSSLFLGPA